MNYVDEYREKYDEWQNKFLIAQNMMLERRNSSGKVLIEIAAQHPLKDQMFPGEEFKKRLDMGIDLYRNLTIEGKEVEIYVPGSRHRYKGINDKISLSEAGRNYLVSQGLTPSIIHGDDLNFKYKGQDGCYNSADECFIAANYFKDENFETLYSICSPAQLTRKELFYINFGVIAQLYSAPNENLYHNPINEVFISIPNILLKDSSWQGENSEPAIKSRLERKVEEDYILQ